MSDNDEKKQAEVLDAYLRGEFSVNHPDLPAEEAALADRMREFVSGLDAPPDFQAQLEEGLIRTPPNRPAGVANRLARLGRELAWIGAAVVLVLGLGWLIRNLAPLQPQQSIVGSPTADMPSGSPTLGGTQVPPVVVLPAQLTVLPSPLPTQPYFTSPLVPGARLVLQAAFPPSPVEAGIYVQAPASPIDLNTAKSLAAQLGVTGGVYTTYGEVPGGAYYLITDGDQRVIIGDTSNHFYYTTNYSYTMEDRGPLPSLAEMSLATEDFLSARGLLDYAYTIEPLAGSINSVGVIPLLDGIPVRYSMGNSPPVTASFVGGGGLRYVDCTRLEFQQLGQYPIRTVEQAWDQILNYSNNPGVESNQVTIPISRHQSWLRRYPLGERVDLYGFVEILQPAEADISPLVFFNNILVEGNWQGMTQLSNPWVFIHAWGVLSSGPGKGLTFQVEGWEVSPRAELVRDGMLERRGDQTVFITSEGPEYEPLDLPGDAPVGVIVTLRGAVIEQAGALPILDWWWMVEGNRAGGGGGGGGGPGFYELDLEGRSGAKVPFPTPTPILLTQSGERIEGLPGVVDILLHQYKDGTVIQDIHAYIQPTTSWPDGLYMRLDGDLTGIEQYHMMPLRLWGVFTGLDDLQMPILKVERFEALYPEMKYQAWLGSVEPVTLEGQGALLLVDQQGQRYVLSTSIGSDPYALASNYGELVIIEGLQYPDETIGGYPVIRDFAMSPDARPSDLTGYELQFGKPPVIQEGGQPGEPLVWTIDKIELISIRLQYQFIDPGGSPAYVQPVWRFSGTASDGTYFEILVQALADQYLQ